ncbi:MAG: hypothetical protein K2I81_01305 [Alphaproteobacteria bacterium]|nr:hypothetical protein [Alphaproteobacteria bacterium]
MKRPFDKINKNDIIHDNIDIIDTINYTNRYRFYNAIEEMVFQKIKMADELQSRGICTNMPIIRINLACPDEKLYPSQSERVFKIMTNAKRYGLIIETNVVEPVCLNSWVGRLIRETATPGFRNIFESAYHYYYPQTYNLATQRKELSPHKIIISPNDALQQGLCDFIFLNNGTIKSR